MDEPARQLEFPADVDVFGDHVRAPATHRLHRRLAKGHHHPGHGKDGAIDALGPLDETYDGTELTGLDLADDGGAGTHPRVAGDGPHLGALDEVFHHPAHSVMVEHGIAVYAHQYLPLRPFETIVEGHGLALIVLVQHGKARILRRQPIQSLPCVILAAIIDGQHLEIGITLAQQVADGLLHIGPLVVAGHHQGHLGIARQHQPGSGERYVPLLPLEVVIEAATDPHHGHHAGVGQGKNRNA